MNKDTNHSAIRATLAALKFGPPQSFGNCHVLPIVGGPPSAISYRSFGEALASNTLRIAEVTDFGVVPNVRVLNESDQPVLFVDGEEIAGAKQNRTLNATILVPARSRVVAPVSCTEAGRWGYTSREFSDSGVFASRTMRAKKNRAVQYSIGSIGTYNADQREIWDSISELHTTLGSTSPTGAMKDAFDDARPWLDTARTAFPLLENQRGLVFIRDGGVSAFDLISRPDAYASLHDKLVSSLLIDRARDSVSEPDVIDAEALTRWFVAAIAEAPSTKRSSVGVGTDIRFSNDAVFGSALLVETEVIHLNAFPAPNGSPDDDLRRTRGRLRFRL